MMRKALRMTLGLAGVLVLVLVFIGAVAQARWDRTFDVAEPTLRASVDSVLIERGRYLAYGPAHCAYCHSKAEAWPLIDAGGEPPLSGGYVFDLPFGRVHTPNLTPDAETGIGRWTDGQLARMLRHNVRPDDRAAVPFMEFQNMSDEDVVALMSFLRSQPAVRNEVPAHELNAIGKAIMAFVIKPVGPAAPPPATAPAEAATVERGEYLANNVAACAACHSKRNMLDGSYIGPRLAGGGEMPFDHDPSQMFVTPNLTPDPETGHIHGWTEDQFVGRFRAGRVFEGSHMPWAPFGKMSDDDIRAIFRYLRSLDPVVNETGPLIQPTKK